ncbi:MAG: hypothetical protein HND52_05450 [Ignavibacteriae bacterium]|nr:hypothetical protein [Ignavibacteriota bacterium]NOG97398.1 hypothetical protein [Ignavibacteriota bacterium]
MIKNICAVLFSIVLLFSCDKIGDEIVEPQVSFVKVQNISAPNFVVYSPSDSSFVAAITFTNSEFIKDVWLSLSTTDGLVTITKSLKMFDDGSAASGDQTAGDNKYSAKIILSKSNPFSDYNIEFYVKNLNNNIQKVAVHKFLYDNGQFNAAPIIENVFAPDTIVVESPKSIFRVIAEVSDSNGAQDISSVWFTSTRPDGSSSGAKIFLNDLGLDGDETAGDGKYSIVVEVTPANTKGTYRFDFQAQDRRQTLSEIISYFITLE